MVKRRSPFTTTRAIAGVTAAAAAAAIVVAGCSMPAHAPETRSPSPPTRVEPAPSSPQINNSPPVADEAAVDDPAPDVTFSAPTYGGEDPPDVSASPTADAISAVAPVGAVVATHVGPLHAVAVAPISGANVSDSNGHSRASHDQPTSPSANLTPAPAPIAKPVTPVDQPADDRGPLQLQTVAVDPGTWIVLAEVAAQVPGHDRDGVVRCQLLDTTTAAVLDETTGSVADEARPVAGMELTAQLTLTEPTTVAVSCIGPTDGSIIHGAALVAVAASMPMDQVSTPIAQTPLGTSESSVATVTIGAGRWLAGFRVTTTADDAKTVSCRLAATEGGEAPQPAVPSMDPSADGSLSTAVVVNGPTTVSLLCRAEDGDDALIATGVLWALLPASTPCSAAVATGDDRSTTPLDPQAGDGQGAAGSFDPGSQASLTAPQCTPNAFR